MRAEGWFPVMGGTGHALVLGPDAELHLAYARRRLVELERAWSRFVPGSDVSRLNSAGGRALAVSRDTLTLVRQALAARDLTGGLFDPTVHAALVCHGYDRDLGAVRAVEGPAPEPSGGVPGCAGIELDAPSGRVRLPAGVGFDPGGIGKGLAADLVCGELLAAGATGVLVNVGGDLRAAGCAPRPHGWVVAVADPLGGPTELMRLALDDGGVATSSTLRRRWSAGGREVHHLLDPASGSPTAEALVAVTVVAASAACAEALTKAVLVSGDPHAARCRPGAEYVAVSRDGRRHASRALEPMLSKVSGAP